MEKMHTDPAKGVKRVKEKMFHWLHLIPLLPLWDLMGVTLGFGTAMLGEKAAMLCTASVEEVIDEHYKNQTFKLKDDEKELKKKIEKFRADEIEHKNIAYDSGATKKGPYGLLDKIIKTSSRIAITISEKI